MFTPNAMSIYRVGKLLRRGHLLSITLLVLLSALAPCRAQPLTAASEGHVVSSHSDTNTLVIPPDILSKVPPKTEAAKTREILQHGSQVNLRNRIHK